MISSLPPHHPPTLEVEHLSVAYQTRQGQVPAVRDVSFSLFPGEIMGLAGESGCGKSTLAFGLLDYLGPNGRVRGGSIRFLGQDMVGRSVRELRRIRGNQVAMVYQDPGGALNPALPVGRQLAEVLVRHQALSRGQARARARDMLARVHLPDPGEIMGRFPHQLSGGQQQRVVMAMALLTRPALLIMDEPTTALDVTVEASVLELVAELRAELGTSMLFISHNLALIARLCDRLAVMYAGQIVEQAGVVDFFRAPAHPYSRGLLGCLPRVTARGAQAELRPMGGHVPAPGEVAPEGCAFAPRCAHARRQCRAESPPLAEVRPDRRARCFFASKIVAEPWPIETSLDAPRTTLPDDKEQILGLDQVRVYYGHRAARSGRFGFGPRREVKAVDGVDLHLGRGRILGLVGESGCGKSTLARAIIGLEGIGSGRLEVMGLEVDRPVSRRDRDLIKEIQMVFQNPDATLNPAYCVGRQIGRALRTLGGVSRAGLQKEVDRLLRAVRLGPEYASRTPRSLSGGEKQRVALARALAGRPGLVLCDEPVSSLDVSVQAAVLNLLADLRQERGMSLVFISHDLSVVRHLADQVAVMYLGQIIEAGPTVAVFAPPHHPYTEALLAAAPVPDPDAQSPAIALKGAVPSPVDPPTGCRFHPRCPRRELMPDGGRRCRIEGPPWREAAADHRIRCHLLLDVLRGLGRAAD